VTAPSKPYDKPDSVFPVNFIALFIITGMSVYKVSTSIGIILSVSPVLVRMESLNISIPAPHAFSPILLE